MDCFPSAVRREITQLGHNELASSIELLHTKLLKYRLPAVHLGNANTEEEVTVGHFMVIWQSHLHRVVRLMVSCGSCIANNDPYGLAVLTRAHVESTAVLTSVYARIDDVLDGKSTFSVFDEAVNSTLAGSRFRGEGKFTSTNVMTHIKKADSYINAKAPMNIKSPLSTIYEAISEYSHPNVASNSMAFTLKEPLTYEFNHRGQISEGHVALLGMLNTSAMAFEHISRSIHATFEAQLTGAGSP